VNISAVIGVIFHSNADCERQFSLVTKNKSNYCASLHTNTLDSVITRKTMSAMSKACHSTERIQELARRHKSSTHRHHQETALTTASSTSNVTRLMSLCGYLSGSVVAATAMMCGEAVQPEEPHYVIVYSHLYVFVCFRFVVCW